SVNLLCAGLMSQNILKEIGKSDKIANSLQQYAKMIQAFENIQFQSVSLKELQNQLKNQEESATSIVNELANLFEKLNTVANLFIFIAFNGTFQYHFWVYRKLQRWKQKNKHCLWQWIQVIGKAESFNSLANYAYNNKEYKYPQVSDGVIQFTNL